MEKIENGKWVSQPDGPGRLRWFWVEPCGCRSAAKRSFWVNSCPQHKLVGR